jgi:hypothetical protein
LCNFPRVANFILYGVFCTWDHFSNRNFKLSGTLKTRTNIFVSSKYLLNAVEIPVSYLGGPAFESRIRNRLS